ncbi:MAG: helix-turn-helix domain-containing protein [Nitrospira sp.]
MATNKETEIDKSLYTSLKELGLLESEASLYLTSLKLGPVTIASLAEHLSISRPNVYKAITGLEKHGLAKFSEKKRYSRTFVVEPPTVALELLRKKRGIMSDLEQTLVGVMPELLANYHQGETPTKIKVLQGKEQYLKAFFSILDEEGEETQFFGSAKDFVKFISWDEEYRWMGKREERGIFVKSLLLPDEDAEMLHKTDKEHLREIRIIKGLAPFVTAFQLYANKALIWQPAGSLAVLIEDEYIVAMLRSIFNTLWDSAK